ncbi:MAG: DUF4269 domain-containing protein [Anaerolineales bacterium]
MTNNAWQNITYLLTGTPTQRAAYEALTQTGLLEILREFSPTLVGTIPLDIDIPGSDLDILCEVSDFPPFATLTQASFGHFPNFYQNTKLLNNLPSHITRFTFGGFPIEIVAQPIPITEQRAYRHLLAEAHLLAQGSEAARTAICALKLSGMKTEPAFGQYFGLQGDPYQVLLDMDV